MSLPPSAVPQSLAARGPLAFPAPLLLLTFSCQDHLLGQLVPPPWPIKKDGVQSTSRFYDAGHLTESSLTVSSHTPHSDTCSQQRCWLFRFLKRLLWEIYFRADIDLPGLLHILTRFDTGASRKEFRMGFFSLPQKTRHSEMNASLEISQEAPGQRSQAGLPPWHLGNVVGLPEDESGGARAGIPPVGHSPQVWHGEHQEQFRLGHTSANGALLPREGDQVEAGTIPLTCPGCRT